jgi:hypothetical protein
MSEHLFVLAIATSLLFAGCATRGETGALAGGALGAGTGAIIGKQLGNTGAGALLGGALGAISGGIMGNAIDDVERRADARVAAATARPNLTVGDVVQMTHSGVAEETILASIRSTNGRFQLTAADIVSLHNQGVSDRVIQGMLDADHRAPAVVRNEPVVVHRRVVYDYDPQPVIVLGHGHHHHCW